MIQFLEKRSSREIILAGITLLMILTFLLFHYLIRPAYRQWQDLRAQVHLQTAEFERLQANLSVKDSVNQAFDQLPTTILQQDTDQITLSQYLRELESLARYPSLALITLKPQPVQREPYYKIYPIQLTVAGKLPEILQFVTDTTHGSQVTGLREFNLRAIQGVNMVECQLALGMVRLLPEPDQTRPTRPDTRPNPTRNSTGKKTEIEHDP